MTTMSSEQISKAYKVFYAYNIMFPLIRGCIKTSVLFFYMRIFPSTAARGLHKLLVALTAVIVLWATAFVFVGIFKCGTSFAAYWDESFEEYCPGAFTATLSLSASDFATDVVVMCSPFATVGASTYFWG